jgi:hypothetical protein
MAPIAKGDNHTMVHQQDYFNHSMNMKNSQDFNTKMAIPLGGGKGNTMDHMLQNKIVTYGAR